MLCEYIIKLFLGHELKSLNFLQIIFSMHHHLNISTTSFNSNFIIFSRAPLKQILMNFLNEYCIYEFLSIILNVIKHSLNNKPLNCTSFDHLHQIGILLLLFVTNLRYVTLGLQSMISLMNSSCKELQYSHSFAKSHETDLSSHSHD